MARCLIGCGSNLGNRREQLDRAIELLRFMPGVALMAVSRFRETAPVGGPAGQPPYLNAACLVETDLSPDDVLEMLLAIEGTLERERTERWSARTIDLDLLMHDHAVVDSPRLTLPHPRMTTRRFVLEPAVEIAAEMRHPLAGCTLRELLDNISSQRPLVAIVGVPGSGAPEVADAVADALLTRVIHAPVALPRADDEDDMLGADRTGRWHALVEAWAGPLRRPTWDGADRGAVVDYWLGTVPVAAVEDLPAAAAAEVSAAVDRALAGCVVPQVVILLNASADALAERMAFVRRHAARDTDLFSELAPAAVREPPTGGIGMLLRMQERLERRLLGPMERGPQAPLAVVPVMADDLGRATAEAVAAVEAMI